MWRAGLVAPRHVRSSCTRDRTRVPGIGRRILNHCAAREAQICFLHLEIKIKNLSLTLLLLEAYTLSFCSLLPNLLKVVYTREGGVRSYCLMGIEFQFYKMKRVMKGFPGGAVVENLPANAGDTGSSPGLGGSHMPWGD